ncbi:MAG: hypothetical protein OEW67_12535 [Cyclobacteriaceae bacterium]|nr:hypothetical protein [Cyclobacteriaceae bacterium]
MKYLTLLIVALIFTSCGEDDPATINENVIGIDGGIVTSNDNKVSIEIPANALVNDTEISINPTTSHPANNIGAVYDFGPDGTQFISPAKMSFSYNDSDLMVTNSGNNLTIAYDNNNSWALLNSTVDLINKVVTADVDHFTSFGLTYRNMIVYADQEYAITRGEVFSLGLGDPFDPEFNSNPTHVNYEFSIFDSNESIWINAGLYSKEEGSFTSGTFVFQNETTTTPADISSKDFFFTAQIILDQNTADFAATDGIIKISGDPSNKVYSIEYDLTYSNGKTAKGIYTGVFQ